MNVSFALLCFISLVTASGISALIMHLLRRNSPAKSKAMAKGTMSETRLLPDPKLDAETSQLIESLATVLPSEQIILPNQDNILKYYGSSSYWCQQSSSAKPISVISPTNPEQLSSILSILSKHHQSRLVAAKTANKHNGQQPLPPIFAIRSGGHCLFSSALHGGIIIDMRHFNTIIVSDDKAAVALGPAARWGQVTKTLEGHDLAVAGGRDASVGVGGLILAGGVSYFSPEFGWVSSTVLQFQVVLASGIITHASATENPDLFNALKVGSNNFGIVTSITLPTFKSRPVWSGLVYSPSFEAENAILALHEWLNKGINGGSGQVDPYAAGPIAVVTYVNSMKISAVTSILAHTKPTAGEKGWPASFKSSRFNSLWRFWNTCKVQPLSTALDEIGATNPHGRRRFFTTTVIKNDLPTLKTVYQSHLEALKVIKKQNVPGLYWNMLVQPLPPAKSTTGSVGNPGPLGLSNSAEDPLILVLFTGCWEKAEHDNLIKDESRKAVERIDAMAIANKTSHPFRYLNYSDVWQKPFQSYGKENLEFLQQVSKKYDEAGLFQTACVGAYKLFDEEEKE